MPLLLCTQICRYLDLCLIHVTLAALHAGRELVVSMFLVRLTNGLVWALEWAILGTGVGTLGLTFLPGRAGANSPLNKCLESMCLECHCIYQTNF